MLTVLQEQLAAAHGLAMAATAATRKVEERVDDRALRHELRAMRTEAEETRARCLAVERLFGEETARELLQHANVVHEKGIDLAGAWFKAGTGPLAAWSFLAMGEAGEVAAWTQVTALCARAGAAETPEAVAELAAWALPLQQRHLSTVLEGAVVLAAGFDPAGPRWG